jgi:hypothetical protein
MQSTPPPTLERVSGGLALLIMLALFAMTFGTPADAAPAPIIIVATPALEQEAIQPLLPARLGSLEPAASPVSLAAPAVPEAQPLPTLTPPSPTETAIVAPAAVLAPVVALEAAPPTAEPPPTVEPTVEPTAAIVRQVGRMTIVRERLPERQERP